MRGRPRIFPLYLFGQTIIVEQVLDFSALLHSRQSFDDSSCTQRTATSTELVVDPDCALQEVVPMYDDK